MSRLIAEGFVYKNLLLPQDCRCREARRIKREILCGQSNLGVFFWRKTMTDHTTEKEVWKTIKDYEGLYEVSNQGRVRSYYRRKTDDPRILVPNKTNHGYHQVTLCWKTKYKKHSIHRLVAREFIPNLDNKLEINHKDGNKTNNYVSNLEWCTRSENGKHAYNTGLISRKGTLHHRSKFNLIDIILIKNIIGLLTAREIAKVFNTHRAYIIQIQSGERRNDEFTQKELIEALNEYRANQGCDTQTILPLGIKLEVDKSLEDGEWLLRYKPKEVQG